MGVHHRLDHPVSPYARLLGSACSGFLEIAIFHPFDTVGKRLMSHQNRVFIEGETFQQSIKKANVVVFKEAAEAPFGVRYKSLLKGVSLALWYKVFQRAYRFGGQPMAAEWVDYHYCDRFESLCGPKYCKPVMHALTGAMVGIGEMVIVPFDVLKIKRQTNPEAFRGRSTWEVVKKENYRLYRGAGWTAARNAPGSFALFGGAALAKDHIFGLEDYNNATVFQNFVASIVGGVSCIVVANPMDVVKTRVQNKNFDKPEAGFTILKNMVKQEGIGAFFKGFTPKMLVVAPKLMFAYTTSQTFIQYFDKTLFKKT